MDCLVCGKPCTRENPQVCTPCFIQGWGRLPDMPLPKPKVELLKEEQLATVEERPVYVSDKDRRKGKR